MDLARKTGDVFRSLHWARGTRAGLAVAGAMVVCYLFPHSIGWAAGWAALGGFEAILVDNGGPYRSRFATIATLMVGSCLACVAGAAAVGHGPVSSLLVPMAVTASFCFATTFARVAAQPIASTSVIILVVYFVALGSSAGGSGHSVDQALWNALAFVAGCAWAGVLSLILWPVDPFRPTRLAVADCYAMLGEFSATIAPTERGSEARELARRSAFEWQRRMRTKMETGRTALAATAARAPSRTHRARNLTVLLETTDMLLVVTMHLTELALALPAEVDEAYAASLNAGPLRPLTHWLSEAEQLIAAGLRRRAKREEWPAFETPLSLKGLRNESGGEAAVLTQLAAVALDAAQNIEIAGEAVKAVWSGIEAPAGTTRLIAAATSARETGKFARTSAWTDSLRANWTLDSVMMRHALRMTLVGAVDVVLLRVLHLSHGYWLGMTSIIVLQPYPSHTLKRGIERVGGTIAGGILAAVLAAAISSDVWIVAAVTATSVLTLATYAVDYGWYSFFLTPTFVLLSLPHLGDWSYSGVRMLTTLLGAAVAVAAMRLLWPEREHLALGKLLGRSALAEAAYLRALLDYWRRAGLPGSASVAHSVADRRLVEREVLAPARRSCGLASNDAEESLDRLKLESGFGRLAPATRAVLGPNATRSDPTRARAAHLHTIEEGITEHALTFTTYTRRLTQSITTLAVLGSAKHALVARLERLASRMETAGEALLHNRSFPLQLSGAVSEDDSDMATHQMQRMERQVSVLERAAAGISEIASSSGENLPAVAGATASL